MTTILETGAPKALEPKGFEALVREQHRRLLAYGLALTRRNDVAEDLVQDALLIAHRDFAKFDAARDFGAWVRGIVRMKYLEWIRERRTEPLDAKVLDEIERQHQAFDRASDEEPGVAVRDCIARLGPRLGETLELHYRDDESFAAIAGRLGITEEVVRKRLQRARELLADCLRRRMGGRGS
jgi:RNA polymerase sigma-70 factor (ECF subfamily)